MSLETFTPEQRSAPEGADIAIIAWTDVKGTIHTRMLTESVKLTTLDELVYLYAGVRANFHRQMDEILKAASNLCNDKKLKKIGLALTEYLEEVDAGKITPDISRHSKFSGKFTEEEEEEKDASTRPESS